MIGCGKRWSRLNFNPRMNHPTPTPQPKRSDSRFVYNDFGSSFIHWLRGQAFSPVLVTQEEGGGYLRFPLLSSCSCVLRTIEQGFDSVLGPEVKQVRLFGRTESAASAFLETNLSSSVPGD